MGKATAENADEASGQTPAEARLSEIANVGTGTPGRPTTSTDRWLDPHWRRQLPPF